MRAHNLALVLQTVVNSADRPSRAAIAGATGLTRATVSALVDDLIAGGLLTEQGPAPRNGAGRPATALALSPDGPAGLGLEINVDYLAACVVDLTGAVRYHFMDRSPTLAGLGELAARARAAAAEDGLALAGAALAVPGLVAPGGLVRVAPNLGWQDVDPIAYLRRTPALADLPITVDNEANLAALGELRAGDGEPTFVYVSGEVGIGAGIVIDGDLYRGGRGWSGEIGHVTVYPDGRPCRCGANGCLEQYAGAAMVAEDPALAAASLGIALSAVVNLLDLDVIVLGGGYAPLFAELSPGIEAEMRRRVLTAGLAPVTLRPASLGADAAVRGAADAVIRGVQDDPATWLALQAV
ncbi:Sugar kinase of the NBD/HSP70 family, may contain an N-terminal HTH domain [Paractinoplanes atraurantiacus]|uniref:Sugar kinase of the NBD/HSP70 family, may contain an N-terminal HTH domain n=1 Tax=Paractinoplanes atraurantiacus TaxID=1036182 RepID=A0A285H4B6_9ACTN|nr:Sugar kinase of the NBD/HSP70 family, may contain an N-terminal HTH domain [Actinoplanes atraurantiacus]